MKVLDAYDIRARLAVTYLVFSPLVVVVIAFALGTADWWSKLGGVAVACGGPLLAAQWGRSGGRRKEPELWERWGGSPTLALLRFSSGSDSSSVERRHQLVSGVTGITLPDAISEKRDPKAADAAYEDAVAALRELTRDRSEFPLVWEEVTNYGFRRNLWGRKAFGLALALTTAGASTVILVLDAVGHGWNSTTAAVIAAAYAFLAALVWATVISPEWVKETAEAYAQRLLESAIRLPPRATP
jgi:hypothetical protein